METTTKEKLLNDNEIKKIELDILHRVHEFCIKKGLRYSLSFGTLIGAVRHQGFIPWDDDIDIMMPRPDYDRFMREFNGTYKHLYVQNFENDDTWTFFQGKVLDSSTICKENESYSKHLFIDVFPCDALPKRTADYENYFYMHKIFYKKIYRTARTYDILRTNKKIEKAKYYIKKALYPKRADIFKDFHRFLDQFPFDKAMNFHLQSYANLIIMPTCSFNDLITIPFEDLNALCIKNYDIFLRQAYGDYMQLPPVDERISHHLSEVYLINH